MLRRVIAVGTALAALTLTGCQADRADPAAPTAGIDPIEPRPAGAPFPGAAPATPAGGAPSAGAAVPVPSPPATPGAAVPGARTPQPGAPAAKPTGSRAASPKAALTKAAPAKAAPAKAAPKPTGPPGRQLRVSLTGYSYHDNSPAGSPEVCCGVLHENAGGRGTYADPITVAVPGSGSGMDWKPGTRFYLPKLQRYVIVEDSGASSGENHLDVWIDGRDGSRSATDDCMDRITGKSTAELNPPPGRPVLAGPIFSGGKCRLPS